MENVVKLFIENIVSNVEERRDENNLLEWGRPDAYALIAGALDTFKGLSDDVQEDLIKYFEAKA